MVVNPFQYNLSAPLETKAVQLQKGRALKRTLNEVCYTDLKLNTEWSPIESDGGSARRHSPTPGLFLDL